MRPDLIEIAKSLVWVGLQPTLDKAAE